MPKRTDIPSIFGIGASPIITGQTPEFVQCHSEASPGPRDSFYLFERFVGTSG